MTDKTITRILVANRGEIARRVFTTARRLGIETVAVHSDADAGLPFVAEADQAVRLPGNTPAETYLRADLVIEAARKTGADAIHPGYGFLSENADFARAVTEAGIAWIGPAPESIVSMGSKIESKKLMEAAGVPVLADLGTTATEADLPLLVKASAGGGGRGMRIVRDLAALASEVELASAEAASAFGDGTVFVEPYVEHGRHVEVQVVGDHSGTVAVFGERDCSIQRRHQKVIEEAPAPGLSDETRAALHEAARNAAAAIDYVGAGTVEFLVDASDPTRFWFLEMNTRLQVEHPVSEAIFGVDLVEAQIAVAEGRPLGHVAEAAAAKPNGHAVEVRLYAEDPAADWQPQSGTLGAFEIPGVQVEFANPAAYGLRLDTGFVAGSEVGTHYDAMLAKVIVHAATREQALRQLAGALAKAKLHGLTTNRDLLVEVLRHPVFVAGDVSTDFFETQELANRSSGVDETLVERSAFAATVALMEAAREARTVQRGIPVGWRNIVSAPQVTEFALDGIEEPVRVEWYGGRDGYSGDSGAVLAASPTAVTLEHDGVAVTYAVAVDASSLTAPVVHVDSPSGYVKLTKVPRFVDPSEQVATGSLLAPMPGSVISVAVEEGQQVTAGQTVLVMEAMKMQHTITAPTDGVVANISVKPGSQVGAGDVLAVVEGEEGAEA
ncbi:biotin carboxylase N-terminal domain-containing protein [Nocardioides daphniae]|uniref:Acetyl/propionyl-CoA carboxylase subuit alpha n=2 Tax=Nocardioides daphniae TaxID=402297 RepID=A0ABQ1Q1K3_9ACTN|nr:biotin carboxylase N-terminal domain-containing protein [Nocardioides daphniae]GGD09148.1 acetyl/propionyl-CoA carboxylase subuit alpha [Nocardioides daphniae]